MNRVTRVWKFVKDLSRQSVRVKRLSGQEIIFFSKTFHNQKNLHSLQHIDDLIANASPLKKGRSTTIVKTNLHDLPIVIKRYNTSSRLNGIKQIFRVSKAYNSWFIAHWLLKNNIATPKPLAAIELKMGLIRKRSYYLYEYLEFQLLSDWLAQNKENTAAIKQMAYKIEIFFNALFRARCAHHDCKITNLPIYQNDLCAIDLDHTYYYYSTFFLKRRLRKDRDRFLRNFDNQPAIQAIFSQQLQTIGMS